MEKTTLEEEMARENLHRKQILTTSDIASIVLWVKGTDSKILLHLGSDGYGKIAIVKSIKEVPDYYQSTGLVLSGAYKIMHYDCSENYNNSGIEIEDKYIQVYRANKSYILLTSI